MAEWVMKKLKDIANFNPRESLAKGVVAKKVAMDKLQPFCRDIPGYELEPFSGGTKFRNGDTKTEKLQRSQFLMTERLALALRSILCFAPKMV